MRKRHTDFLLFETEQLLYVISLCDFLSKKSIPTSHTVPEERQSTYRTVKLISFMLARKHHLASARSCSQPWACFISEVTYTMQ